MESTAKLLKFLIEKVFAYLECYFLEKSTSICQKKHLDHFE